MPTLSPGDGINWTDYDAAKAALAPVGAGKYSTADTIGRWTMVVNQEVSGTIKVGIVGSQPYGVADMGIASIDYFLQGGPACTAAAPSENTSINPGFAAKFCDFNVDLDTSLVGDERIEIRAIVRPTKGVPFFFEGEFDTSEKSKSKGEHSLWLWANDGGTLTHETKFLDPVGGSDANTGASDSRWKNLSKAIEWSRTGSRADGMVVKSSAGNIEIPGFAGQDFRDFDRWFSIEPDDDTDVADLHVSFAEDEHYQGVGVKLLRIRATIDPDVNITQAGDATGWVPPAIWFDGCDRNGGDIETGFAGAQDSSFSLGVISTDCEIHDMNTALNGGIFAMRNHIYNIGEDVYRDFQGLAALNDIEDVTQPGDNHSDLAQFQFGYGTDGRIENVVHTMNRAKRVGTTGQAVQGIFVRSLFAVPTHKRISFMNNDYSYGGNGQFLHSMDCVCIFHETWGRNAVLGVGGNLNILKDPPDSPDTEITNISVQHSFIDTLSLGSGPTLVDEPTAADTSWADCNHVRFGVAPGTDITTGGDLADLFVGPGVENYAPKEGGTLTGRTATLLCPTDVLGVDRIAVGGAIGAYEEGSVPTNPPVLSDIERRITFGVPFSTTIPNSGDLLDTYVITDPTHLPDGLAESVVAGVGTISGTPTT